MELGPKSTQVYKEMISSELNHIKFIDKFLDRKQKQDIDAAFDRLKPSSITTSTKKSKYNTKKDFQTVYTLIGRMKRIHESILISMQKGGDPANWINEINNLRGVMSSYIKLNPQEMKFPPEVEATFKKNTNQSFQSVFMMPVQRAMRYALLLQELNKQLKDEKSPQLTKYNKALEGSKDFAEAVNRGVQKFEDTNYQPTLFAEQQKFVEIIKKYPPDKNFKQLIEKLLSRTEELKKIKPADLQNLIKEINISKAGPKETKILQEMVKKGSNHIIVTTLLDKINNKNKQSKIIQDKAPVPSPQKAGYEHGEPKNRNLFYKLAKEAQSKKEQLTVKSSVAPKKDQAKKR